MRRVKEWLRRRRVRKLAERILANQQIIGWRDSRESIAADTIQMAEVFYNEWEQKKKGGEQ